ncbi:hypothetical protein RJ641_012905 [Dillenia turbinata]|uniref:Uncharacterized protein n=1 Tax=Dillenia turbinata TaxID=194707 RepID=A0AAN8Z6J4_9MAGN
MVFRITSMLTQILVRLKEMEVTGGNWAMSIGRKNSGSSQVGNTLFRARNRKYLNNVVCGMEFDSDWTRHKKSLAHTALVIRPATSFMAWSCKIPIGDGFHEFL